MKKLLLIDGHGILNRAFYGVPDLTNDKGLHTNAVYGFLNIMFKIIDEEKPTHLVVAFDVSAPTFRHEIYKEYKGTRHPAPEEFRQQVPMMKDVLCAMGITIKEKAGLEADDILGTHAKRAEKDGFEVTLLSGDRDLLQIASDNIKIRIPKTSKGKTEVFDYYAKDVENEYHVTPLKFIELKALMGDTSDNIPGIAGVGPKTAMGLMEQFGSIEGIYSHIDDIKSASLREKVRNGKDSVDLSKILATINIDADIETDWDKCLMGNMFGPEAYDKYVELGLRKLLSKFDDVSKETCNTAESIDDITTRITHMTDAGEYESFIDKCCNKEGMTAVKLMYEKKGGRFEENSGQLSLFEVGDTSVRILAGIYDGDDIYYIDSKFVGEDVLTQGLKRLYQSGNMVVTHDVKDYYLLAGINDEYADGIDKKIRDVSLAAYLINPLKSNPPMEYIASEYAGLFIPDIELPAKKESLSEAASNRRRECMNKLGLYAYGIYNSYSGLMKLLDEYKMTHLYEKMEMPVSYVLYSMERRGVLVKKEELTAFGDSLAESTEKLEESIYKQAGEKFNINSPKQLGELLFGKMGLEGGKKTKTGYSTGAEVLEKLAPTCPMVKDILEYRTLTKLKSTFVDSLGDYIGDDGRIHSNFNQTITATGRISSTEPNLQNIPTRTDLGRQIRKMFVAGEGNVLCDADYSQVELRILASFAGDKELIDAYKNNKDNDNNRKNATAFFLFVSIRIHSASI